MTAQKILPLFVLRALLIVAAAGASISAFAAEEAQAASTNQQEPAETESQPPPKAAVVSKGKASLTAYYASGFADAAWQQAAFDRVAKGWVAAAPPVLGKKAVVICQVTRGGKLMESKLGTASGSEAWDKAALDAVKRAAPFRALPAAWAASSLEVHWHFQWVK